MRSVGSRGTSIERQVASALVELGVAFRTNVVDLPGKPDIVIDDADIVVFVNGCWWHGHSCPRGDRLPKTNVDYWRKKIERNCRRDRRNLRLLRSQGYSVWTLWECKIRRQAMPRRLKGVIEQRLAF